MKYCYKCGAPIEDNANFCQNCGTAQKQPQYGQYNQYNQYPQNPQPAKPAVEDQKSFPISLLGFLIPLAGIILYLVWKDETPLKAKSALNGAIAAFVSAAILLAASFILVFVGSFFVKQFEPGFAFINPAFCPAGFFSFLKSF